MASRLELQSMLEKILGNSNVYYQPPASVKMNYPAIVYEREKIDNIHADNGVYTQYLGYSVTVIDRESDNQIIEKISQLPLCRYNRNYKSDNLYHDVFTLYY